MAPFFVVCGRELYGMLDESLAFGSLRCCKPKSGPETS